MRKTEAMPTELSIAGLTVSRRVSMTGPRCCILFDSSEKLGKAGFADSNDVQREHNRTPQHAISWRQLWLRGFGLEAENMVAQQSAESTQSATEKGKVRAMKIDTMPSIT